MNVMVLLAAALRNNEECVALKQNNLNNIVEIANETQP
jgi:hypothetical protein